MSEDPYQKFYKTWLEATKGYMGPWLQSQTGNEEPKSEVPFFGKDWMAQSNEFFQRMLWFPPFSLIQGTAGPVMQNYARYSEIAGMSFELYQKWVNLYLEFSRAMTDVVGKLNVRFLASGGSSDPKQSYGIWLEELTQAMDKMLRDEETASKMASFLSSLMDLKKQSDTFMESYYKMMNIPTKTEMDRVYKELYDLKKAIRALKKNSSS